MNDPNIHAAFIADESMMPVDEWVLERYENCIRIAKTKTDKADIMGWLDDAEYFRRILASLKELESIKRGPRTEG